MKTITMIAAFGIFSIIMCFALPSKAQKGILKLDLNYNYSIPLSGFKTDVVSNNSPRGFLGSLLYSFNDRLSAGLSYGFQDYYQKYPRTIYHLSKSQDISAVLTNSIQTTPFLLKGKYFPLPTSAVKPYVSLAAGLNIIDFKQYFGEFGDSRTNAGFRGEAGAGVMIPFNKSGTSGINAGATYDYAPYQKYGYKDLNSVNFQAGIIIQVK